MALKQPHSADAVDSGWQKGSGRGRKSWVRGRDRERERVESGVASACQPAASRFVRLTANFMVDGFSALAREKAP